MSTGKRSNIFQFFKQSSKNYVSVRSSWSKSSQAINSSFSLYSWSEKYYSEGDFKGRQAFLLHLYSSTDVELRVAQCPRAPLGAALPKKIDGNLLLCVNKNKQLVTGRKCLPGEADNFYRLWIAAFSLVFSLRRCACRTYIHIYGNSVEDSGPFGREHRVSSLIE